MDMTAHEMMFDNGKYLAIVRASIFTNRNNSTKRLNDVRIYKKSRFEDGGFRHRNGELYRTIAVIAAENGDFIRHFERLPSHINVEMLRQIGWIH